MAFGFPPKHVQVVQLEHSGKEHFLVLAIEAAVKLGWDVSFVSETGFVAYTKFSMTSWSEEITVILDQEVATIKSACTGSQLMDWGKNKKNVAALLSVTERVKSELTQEAFELKLAQTRQRYAPNDEDVLNKPPSTTRGKITSFFSIFIPTEGYYITPILIGINLLIFILMLLSGVHLLMPEGLDLLQWGANFRPLTLEGQWWRLFSACFVHIGILHLLLNMYALLYIGLLLEPYLGKTRFLAAYILSGIAASIASLWWHELTISAGASGAIFGMYGVFLALLTTNLLDQSVKKALFTSIAVFVGYNILNGLQPDSGIDNAAHIGGLLSGLVIGYAFIPSLKQFQKVSIKLSTIAVLTIVLLISSFQLVRSLPNDLGEYEKKMEDFVSMESMAMEVFQISEGASKEVLLRELKDRGIYYWKENIKLIESLEALDLPLTIKERNRKLKQYCELRIKSFELIYKAIHEDTDRYGQQIDAYGLEIEAIIEELTGQ